MHRHGSPHPSSLFLRLHPPMFMRSSRPRRRLSSERMCHRRSIRTKPASKAGRRTRVSAPGPRQRHAPHGRRRKQHRASRIRNMRAAAWLHTDYRVEQNSSGIMASAEPFLLPTAFSASRRFPEPFIGGCIFGFSVLHFSTWSSRNIDSNGITLSQYCSMDSEECMGREPADVACGLWTLTI